MNNTLTKKDELYHYGVLGMKWGVRRAQNKLNRIDRKSKKEKWSDEATEAAKIKTKKVGQMSNAELNKLNTRMNLERNYRQLNPGAFGKGLRVAATTVAALGTVAALYTNGKKILDIGKPIGDKIFNAVGNMVLRDINRR